MAQSLFPTQRGGGRGGGGGGGGSQSLLSFKAGKCNLASALGGSGSFNVTADKRKGTISLNRAPDGLMQFRWAVRPSGAPEDERILFPGDAQFVRVNTGRGDTDRVYILRFASNAGSSQKLMYWMQDKDASKDAENVTKFNEFVNNPEAAQAAANALNAAAAGAAAPGGGGGAEAVPGHGLGPEAWMQLMGLGGGGGAGAIAPPPAAAAAATGAAPAALGGLDFGALLGAANLPATPAASAPSSSSSSAARGLTLEDLQRAMMGSSPHQQQQQQQQPALELQNIITREGVMASGILDDPQVLARLIAQLPEEQRSVEHLQEAIRSPQLVDAMRALTRALHSDSFHSIMANIGVNPDPGLPDLMRNDAVAAFITSLQAAADAEAAVAASSSSSSSSSSVEGGGGGGGGGGGAGAPPSGEGSMDQSE